MLQPASAAVDRLLTHWLEILDEGVSESRIPLSRRDVHPDVYDELDDCSEPPDTVALAVLIVSVVVFVGLLVAGIIWWRRKRSQHLVQKSRWRSGMFSFLRPFSSTRKTIPTPTLSMGPTLEKLPLAGLSTAGLGSRQPASSPLATPAQRSAKAPWSADSLQPMYPGPRSASMQQVAPEVVSYGRYGPAPTSQWSGSMQRQAYTVEAEPERRCVRREYTRNYATDDLEQWEMPPIRRGQIRRDRDGRRDRQ